MNQFSSFLKQLLYKTLESISPVLFLTLQFRRITGYWPNLKNPKTYNEKINWLKLYYHNPVLNRCADKYEMRNFLTEKGLSQYLNEVYGKWSLVEDIDFEMLPNKFVLKSTHGTAQTIICNDKSQLDLEETKAQMRKWLNTNPYFFGLEWAYKDIKPAIICEKLIETRDGLPPKDYKFFCFDGIPKLLFVASERIGHNTKFDFFDCDWNLLPFTQGHPNSSQLIQKPVELPLLLEISRQISADFPHIRVDFYIENNQVLIGELTFYHFSGFVRFIPSKFDEILGSYLLLPPKTRKQ